MQYPRIPALNYNLKLKTDFGRGRLQNPCDSTNPWSGDFDCDGDVDGSNAYAFKGDFGRNPIAHPCSPYCAAYACDYP